MNPVLLFTASGPLLGGAGWFFSLSWLFWVGVALCTSNLFLNVASGVMKLPVLPVAIMAGAAVFISPWYLGLGVGLVAWTALESAGEIFGLKKEGRL